MTEIRNFFNQYCKIIAYSLCGLVFAFASFFLIINLYHHLEISKKVTISFTTDAAMVKYQNSLDNINMYLTGFDINKYQGSLSSFQAMAADQKLRKCYELLNNDVMKEFINKAEISIIDIYELRESFENDLMGTCVLGELIWFTQADSNNINNVYLKDNQKLLELYINGLKSETNYLKKDLLNNSSYFFNTQLVSDTLRHNVKDGYYELMASYNKVSGLVELLSEWFYNETKEARL